MNAFINENNEIQSTGILQNCLRYMYRLQLVEDENDEIDHEIPTALQPMTLDEVEQIQYHMSRDKALTLDGFSDKWLSKTK